MKTRILSSVFLLLSALFFSGCFQYSTGPRPSKQQVIKKYSVDAFNQIENNAPAAIVFTQGEVIKVEAEGPENYVSQLRVTVEDGTLNIDVDDKKYKNVGGDHTVLTITAPDLRSISQQSVGGIHLEGEVSVGDLSIVSDGVGSIEADNLNARELKVYLRGVGSIHLTGKAERATYELEGVGSLKAKDMLVSDVSVEQNGVGSVSCYASGTISIQSDGIGSVDYYGNPRVKHLNKSGIGSVNKQ